jgi:hypothetical protein
MVGNRYGIVEWLNRYIGASGMKCHKKRGAIWSDLLGFLRFHWGFCRSDFGKSTTDSWLYPSPSYPMGEITALVECGLELRRGWQVRLRWGMLVGRVSGGGAGNGTRGACAPQSWNIGTIFFLARDFR